MYAPGHFSFCIDFSNFLQTNEKLSLRPRQAALAWSLFNSWSVSAMQRIDRSPSHGHFGSAI